MVTYIPHTHTRTRCTYVVTMATWNQCYSTKKISNITRQLTLYDIKWCCNTETELEVTTESVQVFLVYTLKSFCVLHSKSQLFLELMIALVRWEINAIEARGRGDKVTVRVGLEISVYLEENMSTSL